MKYTVGQNLWWVPPFNIYHKEDNGGYEVDVTKVAIKYVTVATGKVWPIEHVFLKDSGIEKTSHRPGRAWLKREDYETHVTIRDAWKELQKLFSKFGYRGVPANMNMAQIETITGILESLS